MRYVVVRKFQFYNNIGGGGVVSKLCRAFYLNRRPSHLWTRSTSLKHKVIKTKLVNKTISRLKDRAITVKNLKKQGH